MDAAWIALLWLAFAATHMGLSSLRLRPRLVSALGEVGFQGMYSGVALVLFISLCWIYFAHPHSGPHLWYLGANAAVRWVGYVGLAFALGLTVGGLAQPSPAGMLPARGSPTGPLRITRHPAFMGAGLFGLFHLLTANVNAAELAFFAGFPAFAVAGCWHQDRRKLATDAAYARFYAETAFLPFAKSGGLRGLREMPVALAVGVALAFGLRWVHADWFGGVDWLGASLGR